MRMPRARRSAGRDPSKMRPHRNQNRENAYSKTSLVRIIGMGQGGFQKKKTFGCVTRRGRQEYETIRE
jgi:hypothetical protein